MRNHAARIKAQCPKSQKPGTRNQGQGRARASEGREGRRISGRPLRGRAGQGYRALYENTSNLGQTNILASWLDDTSFKGKEVKYSTKYIEDASFLKLDNISASYDFKLKNEYIKKLRLYLTAQNIFCLTGYSGVDPEVSLSGIAPGIEGTSYYPRTRAFTFGATFTF